MPSPSRHASASAVQSGGGRLISSNQSAIVIYETPTNPDGSGGSQISKGEVRLKNESAGKVAYRVHTNAPVDYTMRPNKGFIEKDQTVAIEVTLAEGRTFKATHKIQIQATQVSEDHPSDRDVIWQNIEPDNIQLIRLPITDNEDSHEQTPTTSSNYSAEELTSKHSDTFDESSHGIDSVKLTNRIRDLETRIGVLTKENERLRHENMKADVRLSDSENKLNALAKQTDSTLLKRLQEQMLPGSSPKTCVSNETSSGGSGTLTTSTSHTCNTHSSIDIRQAALIGVLVSALLVGFWMLRSWWHTQAFGNELMRCAGCPQYANCRSGL